MKNKNLDLRIRGMIKQQDVDNIAHLSQAQVIQLINSKAPVERTAAVRLLSIKKVSDGIFIHTLLERLCIEKSLYTKLEICSALEKGDIETARCMIAYLGKIGTNHHKILPSAVSKKVSYPLPRDIIARTLAKMDSLVFPALVEVLSSKDENKISEVMDAIGFMVFYRQKLSTSSNLHIIIETIKRYEENQLIYWKAIICLSSFPLQKSIDFLDYIISNNENQLFKNEAIRSKKLILRRNKA